MSHVVASDVRYENVDQRSGIRYVVWIVVVAVLVGLAVAVSSRLDTRPAIPVQPQTENIKAGETLYTNNCASCHGVLLEGQKDWWKEGADGGLPALPHDETGHTWHHGDGLLFDYTKYGGMAALEVRGINNFKSGMPGFDKVLSDQEIWDILAFIKSTWSEQVRAVQEARTRTEQ